MKLETAGCDVLLMLGYSRFSVKLAECALDFTRKP